MCTWCTKCPNCLATKGSLKSLGQSRTVDDLDKSMCVHNERSSRAKNFLMTQPCFHLNSSHLSLDYTSHSRCKSNHSKVAFGNLEPFHEVDGFQAPQWRWKAHPLEAIHLLEECEASNASPSSLPDPILLPNCRPGTGTNFTKSISKSNDEKRPQASNGDKVQGAQGTCYLLLFPSIHCPLFLFVCVESPGLNFVVR